MYYVCIDKQKDNKGNIIGYGLVTKNSTGIQYLSVKQLKEMILSKQLVVLNLKISKAGNIVRRFDNIYAQNFSSTIEDIIVKGHLKLERDDFKGFVSHTPNKELTEELKQKIRQYGLVHFTHINNIESIREKGIVANKKKAVNSYEKGMNWFFINDPKTIKYAEYEILSKRAPYRPTTREEMLKCIYYPTEEELEMITYRPIGSGSNMVQTYFAEAITIKKDIIPSRLKLEPYYGG